MNLEVLGLNGKEADVYVCLLQLSQASASDIAKHVSLHRTHVYEIVDRLQNKGFVSSQNGTVTTFSAVEYEILIQQALESLELIEKKLSALQAPKDDVSVEVFRGVKGIRTILEDVVNVGEDYYLYGKFLFEELLPTYIPQFLRKINEKKIKEYAIIPSRTTLIPAKYAEYRYLDEKDLPPTALIVYGDRVATFVWEQPYFCIRTISSQNALANKKYFDLLWEKANSIIL